MARRSKWLVFAEGDDRVQTEPLDCSGDGSAAGQQEAQLVQANVKAARCAILTQALPCSDLAISSSGIFYNLAAVRSAERNRPSPGHCRP